MLAYFVAVDLFRSQWISVVAWIISLKQQPQSHLSPWISSENSSTTLLFFVNYWTNSHYIFSHIQHCFPCDHRKTIGNHWWRMREGWIFSVNKHSAFHDEDHIYVITLSTSWYLRGKGWDEIFIKEHIFLYYFTSSSIFINRKCFHILVIEDELSTVHSPSRCLISYQFSHL